jgi:hypothetical protein
MERGEERVPDPSGPSSPPNHNNAFPVVAVAVAGREIDFGEAVFLKEKVVDDLRLGVNKFPILQENGIRRYLGN